MTQSELESLPILDGGIEWRVEMVLGTPYRVAGPPKPFKSILCDGADPALIHDVAGLAWTVVWVDGTRCRMREPTKDEALRSRK